MSNKPVSSVSARDRRLVLRLREQFYQGRKMRGFGLRDEIENPRIAPWGSNTPLGWSDPRVIVTASGISIALQSGADAK